MRLFISAGEPSGDLHGANLALALRSLIPSCDLFGLGGARMRSAGVDLLYPLAEHAVMGFVRVAGVVNKLADLLDRLTDAWHRRRPDAVVLIDYPGFHWWVARRAKALDIPVVSFVPPQIWAWASHRITKMRATFDRVLCALPFELEWFRARGLRADYVGHPYFDELSKRHIDAGFVAEQRRSGPVIAMLPGSRNAEVAHNMNLLMNTMQRISESRPDARFHFACFNEKQRQAVAGATRNANVPVEMHVGRTPEIIAAADACVAVSGSVGLELLYHERPSVVIYRTMAWNRFLFNRFRNVPHIGIVNLAAGRELFPEYLTTRHDEPGPAAHVLRWLNNPVEHQQMVADLHELKSRVALPGACATAAQILIDEFGQVRRAAA